MILTLEQHGEEVRRRLIDGTSYRAIGEHLGCDHTTVARFVRENFPELSRAVRPRRVAVIVPVNEPPDETELLRAEVKELRSAAVKARAVDVQAERLVQEIRDQVTPADVKYEAPKVSGGEGHTHLHVLLLSDLHIGEVVVPEAVNGLNEYNWAIFEQRMTNLQRALFSFQNNRPYPIDELLIALLGDNVSNNHHQELAVTNEFPITEQCHRGGVFLGQWIESLVPHYPTIRCVGVGGNHARVDQAHSSKQVFDSFDWLGFQYAKQHLAKYDIDFRTPRAGMAIADVVGRNMLLWHGDGVKSSMPGVPWGGVMRRVNNLKAQYAEAGVPLDYIALGHWHQANVIQGHIFMNGSVMGLNEHGLKNFGSGEKPTQLLLTFDKQARRLTDVSFITP